MRPEVIATLLAAVVGVKADHAVSSPYSEPGD